MAEAAPVDELGTFLQLVRKLPLGSVAISDTVEPGLMTPNSIDLLVVTDTPRTRLGAETIPWNWGHLIKRPNGLILFHDYNAKDPVTGLDLYPDYTDALNGWLRRDAERWQAIAIVGTQLVVKARAPR
jgi:hypothetical protein